MAQVAVEVNGKRYEIACDDGQEAHLARLGEYIDTRIQELIAAVGQVGDMRLLVMGSLLIADELSDAYAQLKAIEGTNIGSASRMAHEGDLSVALDSLAARIETIAEHLEQG